MNDKHEWEVFTPPRKQKKIQLRFPSDDIFERMKELAQEDNRSLNGEIMQALREFIKGRKRQGESYV